MFGIVQKIYILDKQVIIAACSGVIAANDQKKATKKWPRIRTWIANQDKKQAVIIWIKRTKNKQKTKECTLMT